MLDYWARTGLLTPSITDAHGSGTQRRYSYQDVVELRVVKELIDAGVSLQRARQAVECLRDNLGGSVSSTSLVLAGSNSVLAHSDGEVVDLLRGGQGVFNIVPLGGLVDDLDTAISLLEPRRDKAKHPQGEDASRGVGLQEPEISDRQVQGF